MKKVKQNIVFMKFLTLCFFVSYGQNTNKLDYNGLRDGSWKGYYEDSKNLRYVGNFIHGKEIGLFTYYANNDKNIVMATRNFDGKNGAYTIFFDEKKKKVSEGNVINKLRQGVWTYYHRDSKAIMTVENYIDDKLEGARKVFYIDGKVAEEVPYINNVKEGISKKYSKQAKLIEESIYSKGLLQGVYKVYDETGNIVITGQFKDDLKKGIWKYFDKGKLVKEINTDTIKGIEKPKPRIKENK
jgi:antitoxin component YwqK of YwqJK toxin-antitoxin module